MLVHFLCVLDVWANWKFPLEQHLKSVGLSMVLRMERTTRLKRLIITARPVGVSKACTVKLGLRGVSCLTDFCIYARSLREFQSDKI